MPIDTTLREALEAVTTASLARVLARRGIGGSTPRGVLARSGTSGRVVGPAHTLRLIPGRGDGAPASGSRSLESAIEAIPEGAVVVADASGASDAAPIGEVLAARLHRRGVAALVTDGAGPSGGALPVWCAASGCPASGALVLVGSGEPVALGGAAIYPGDIVVADEAGIVVVPAGIAEAVALEAVEAQRLELWTLREIERGAPLPGLSPPDAGTLARYEAETRPA